MSVIFVYMIYIIFHVLSYLESNANLYYFIMTSGTNLDIRINDYLNINLYGKMKGPENISFFFLSNKDSLISKRERHPSTQRVYRSE